MINYYWLLNEQGSPRRITTDEDWRRIFAEVAPHAVGAIFYWCPTAANASLEPRVIETQFGDGYTQRRPAGLNTQDQEWNLEFANRKKVDAEAILAFLSERNGVDIFNWTPPRTSKVLDVICPDWSWTYGETLADGTRAMTVSARFVQQHA
ncbi:phage tail protein [Paraburkholderia unamae]|uniref:Phage tail protein n=1 Tax=Paraburkholderia unamae TaxID=219649 RepID=A0ACC6RQI3_9BURK